MHIDVTTESFHKGPWRMRARAWFGPPHMQTPATTTSFVGVGPSFAQREQ